MTGGKGLDRWADKTKDSDSSRSKTLCHIDSTVFFKLLVAAQNPCCTSAGFRRTHLYFSNNFKIRLVPMLPASSPASQDISLSLIGCPVVKKRGVVVYLD